MLFQAKVPARKFASTDVLALSGASASSATFRAEKSKSMGETIERVDSE